MTRRGALTAITICAATLATTSASPASAQRADRSVRRLLFVGNSLTAANNLPAMVDALSAAAGGPHIVSAMVAFPDYSLEDHWKRGTAAQTIARGGWSLVVLQQGPSALPESRVLLIEYAKKLDAEARRVGARTALYMVWPSTMRRGDFDGVHRSYEQAAHEVGGQFFPVGDAWRAAWRRDPNVELYQADGFHPTPQATYLAALVIVQQIAGRSPVGWPSRLTSPNGSFPTIAIAPARAALLQQAAAEANQIVTR